MTKPVTCERENCPYEKDKDNWLDSRLLKSAGAVIGILSPLFVWIVVSIFNISGEVALVKQKQEAIMEIKQEIIEMRKDLISIKVQLAALNKGN